MDKKVSRLGLGISNTISNGEGEGEEHGMFFLDENVIMISKPYFEIMVKVAHGGVKDMGSEGDWVQGVLHDPPFARSETNTRCSSI
jgi:hypothetical protein